jgi:effector-binding domain-containing protein
MKIHVTNPITVLCFSTKVTLAGLQHFVRTKARELYYDATINNLEITGPVYWIYYGMDGNQTTEFTLEIALPVTCCDNYQGKFMVKQLGVFKHIQTCHLGNWAALPLAYGELFSEISCKGYTPSGECREVYQHIDFDHPANNRTEVQAGIQ